MILDCMLGSSFGGLEQVFLNQLRILPANGAAVHGVARRASPAARRAREAQLPCSEMVVLSEWDPITLRGARGLIRDHDPKLLLCHGRRAHRIFAKVADGRPIVAMVHKPKFDPGLPAAAYIVVAEHRKRWLVARGVPAEKIAVIPNAVMHPGRIKVCYEIESAPRIVGLGRLHPKKGFDVLIEALDSLAQHGTRFLCTIAGEGPLRGTLEKAVRNRGLSGQVCLTGWTEDVANYLAEKDIFVFPSLQEDFPLALLDAMAVGLPIISSRIDGPKDILSEAKTALLVPPRDAPALANALQRLIADANLRKVLGNNARTEADRLYSSEAIGKKLAGVLTNIVEGRSL
jgi:glycosyltransferase involved in cell wall biosynthesis